VAERGGVIGPGEGRVRTGPKSLGVHSAGVEIRVRGERRSAGAGGGNDPEKRIELRRGRL